MNKSRKPLTEDEHKALEVLDSIEQELRRSSFTVAIAHKLQAAINQVENAMRGAK